MISTQGVLRPARHGRWAGLLVLAALAGGVAGCSQPPPPGPTDVVEFSATGTAGSAGSAGSAYGNYALFGPLQSNGARPFTGLPFSTRLVTGPGSTPTMSVSVVGVPAGSSVSCRITVDGRVVAAATGPAPGPDVRCSAPGASG